ncbi:MAG: murein biosynthesis integral membrane protein MurJ [Sutterellaceae bacterium]|nr:murein biosynthesis integral membrane protein MurJ [Sutterellaceae bacterium]
MSLLRSAATISVLTLLSRITGLVRDMLIARYFGVGAATDAFYVAFRIPNMLRRLFAEGAFSQAFVPMLSQVKENETPERRQEFVNHVFTLLGLAVFFVSVLGVIFAPFVVWMIASGFSNDTATFDLTVWLTRAMFPYILFMSLVSFAAALLNTWKHFAIPAFTPVLLNLSFIACTLLLVDQFSQPIWALACAVIIGGVLQLSMQLAALKKMGLLPKISNPFKATKDDSVKKMLALMLPACLGVSVTPLSVLINTNIASHLNDGAVTWLNYADRLMEFPTALLGVALGTVLLPGLSSAFAQGNLTRYNTLLDRSLKIVILIGVPASVGLALLSEGLTAVLFQGKNFLASDVMQTSVAMQGYAAGLLGLIAVKIIAPAFYARKDIKTPVKSAIAALIVVQACNFVTVPLFAHAGLALSVTIGSCFNAVTLLVILLRRGWYTAQSDWWIYFVRVIVASVAMGALLYWGQMGVDWTQMQSEWIRRLILVAGVILGAAVTYFVTMFVCGWRARELRGAAKES